MLRGGKRAWHQLSPLASDLLVASDLYLEHARAAGRPLVLPSGGAYAEVYLVAPAAAAPPAPAGGAPSPAAALPGAAALRLAC